LVVQIEAAAQLVMQALLRAGLAAADAKLVADHVIDCELRGVAYGGLSRALTVAERLATGGPRTPLTITSKSSISAMVDGGNQPGYVVAFRATEVARERALQHGIGLVGLHNTWLTGMLSYYMEMLTGAGYVGMAFASSKWHVAPLESAEGRFGANPMAFGFPTETDPIIFDASVSNIMVSDVVLHQRLGRPLPAGSGYTAGGQPTTDAAEVLRGALSVWGGHRGSALGMVIQLLGFLANAEVVPPKDRDQCQLIVALDPRLLVDDFPAKASAYASHVRSARPLEDGKAPRLPFERSLAARRAALARGTIEVADEVHAALLAR
jgi:LDH2 family malate/lactate/ureidoglycolate dehydrogenase